MSHQVFNIEFEYSDNIKLRGTNEDGISDEDYTALRDALVLAELPPLDNRKHFYNPDGIIGTVDDIETLTKFGIIPRIRRVRGIFQESFVTAFGAPPPPKEGQIVNITIPNASLFAVRSLHVIENNCTNYVQEFLDKGWRIVAVCPPNDCRRPTFILGHHDQKPEYP